MRFIKKLKCLEACNRGKLATASKAEKQGNLAKAENYRRQAEQDRENTLNLSFKFKA